MSILIKSVNTKDYLNITKHLDNEIPIWLSPKFIGVYKEKIILLALKADKIIGIWIIPLIIQDGLKFARRQYRFFPYSSPVIFESDNLKRRMITDKFFECMCKKCNLVSLPMSPNFKDLAILQGHQVFIEWRHTYILSHPIDISKIDSRLRNHIKSAQKSIQVCIGEKSNYFNFNIAIKGNLEEKKQRKKLALNLLKNRQAIIIAAKTGKKICAGIFLAFDKETVYFLHSWQEEKTPRGTISNLIFEAINWAFNTKKMKYFDFEGSVIQSIDYFFCGFNADIVPYAYLHWTKDKTKFYSLINKSINIEGRLI